MIQRTMLAFPFPLFVQLLTNLEIRPALQTRPIIPCAIFLSKAKHQVIILKTTAACHLNNQELCSLRYKHTILHRQCVLCQAEVLQPLCHHHKFLILSISKWNILGIFSDTVTVAFWEMPRKWHLIRVGWFIDKTEKNPVFLKNNFFEKPIQSIFLLTKKMGGGGNWENAWNLQKWITHVKRRWISGI